MTTELVSETPITMVELKEKLAEIKKRDSTLNFRANKTKEYLDICTTFNIGKVEGLKKKINGLNIPRLRERQIVKLIDLMPKDMDSLRALIAGENITLKQEDLTKILQIIQET